APAPLIFAAILLLALPVASVINNQQPDFAAALSHWCSAGWPALILVLGLGAALAVYCLRRHRHMSNQHSLAWAIFAALFGVPGLIGYLAHRRWPAVERCQKCDQPSPRDRETCLECGADFPLPAMKGIEVFA